MIRDHNKRGSKIQGSTKCEFSVFSVQCTATCSAIFSVDFDHKIKACCEFFILIRMSIELSSRHRMLKSDMHPQHVQFFRWVLTSASRNEYSHPDEYIPRTFAR